MKKTALAIALIALVCLSAGCKWGSNKTTDQETITESVPENAPVMTIDMTSEGCGDGVCGIDEIYTSCSEDCIESCGNGIADDNENWQNCRYDLKYVCGNGVCDEWEHYRYCPKDCEECIVDDLGTYTGDDKCPPSPRWVI